MKPTTPKKSSLADKSNQRILNSNISEIKKILYRLEQQTGKGAQAVMQEVKTLQKRLTNVEHKLKNSEKNKTAEYIINE